MPYKYNPLLAGKLDRVTSATGDMSKGTYDTNDNGIVDDAEKAKAVHKGTVLPTSGTVEGDMFLKTDEDYVYVFIE